MALPLTTPPLRKDYRAGSSTSAIANTSPFDIYNENSQIAGIVSRKSPATSTPISVQPQRRAALRLPVRLSAFEGADGITVFGDPADRLGRSFHSLPPRSPGRSSCPRKGVALDSSFGFVDSYLGSNNAFPSSAILSRFYFAVGGSRQYFGDSCQAGADFGFTRTGLPSFSLGGRVRLATFGRT